MKICGIYSITSPTNKVYIGQSTDILRRIEHYRNCRCRTQRLLYRSINKYGWDKHKFEILCQCDKSDLNQLEIYYIALFQSFNSEYGLNLESGGKVHEKSTETCKRLSESHKGLPNPNKGKKLPPLSDEAKRNMSLALKGKPKSEETRKRMSIAFKGRKMSEEHKERLRKINSERKRTDEWRKHQSEVLTGRKRQPFTEETKQKLREANLGKKLSEETKQKKRIAMLGKKLTPDHIQKAIDGKKRAKLKRQNNIAA